MKVLLDGRRQWGGLQRYTSNLVRLLSAPGSAITLCGSGLNPSAASFAEEPERSRLRLALGDLRRVYGDQCALPRQATANAANLFHACHHLVPARMPVPAVATCHDLWLLDHPECKPRSWVTRYERRQYLLALRRARAIIAISQTVARQLLERDLVAPERLSVIHPPLPGDFAGLNPAPLPAAIADQPFFLAVGTLEPRKNLERLLDAHAIAYRACGWPLVLVGRHGWDQQTVLARIAAATNRVHWLGATSDMALLGLYRAAGALVSASLDEGFNYPVAEAMAAGLPMALSDIAVHRELADGLAAFAAPQDEAAMATAMLAAAGLDELLRAQRSATASSRIEALRSQHGAGRYLAVYRAALGA